VEGSRPEDIDDDKTRAGSVAGAGDGGRTGSLADEAAEVEAAEAVGSVETPERGPAAYLAEFIGTFGLVFFVTLAFSQVARVVPSASALEEAQQAAQAQGLPVPSGAELPFVDLTVLGLVHVFVLFMLIQTLAIVSGAHFNPAVTAALTAIRQIRPIDAAIYVVVQLAGGVLGALLTKAILKGDNIPIAEEVNWGAVQVTDRLDGSIPLGMLVEGIGAFFLVWAIVGVAVNPAAFRQWAGLVIGGTLGMLVMVSFFLTGGSFNPARAFGPALAAKEFNGADDFLLVYVLAPLIGALLAAFVYMQMFVLPGKKGPFGMKPVG
jgi:MIP family channel proteins